MIQLDAFAIRSKFRQINCLNKQLIQTAYSDIHIYSIYLKGKCREKRIIYKATLTSDDNTKNYFGSYEIEFKACFYNSNQSFEYQRKSNVTELSKAFWLNKCNGKSPQIDWKIVTRTTSYQPGGRAFMLCLSEKCAIFQTCPPHR